MQRKVFSWKSLSFSNEIFCLFLRAGIVKKDLCSGFHQNKTQLALTHTQREEVKETAKI